jgi:hypothetical protein
MERLKRIIWIKEAKGKMFQKKLSETNKRKEIHENIPVSARCIIRIIQTKKRNLPSELCFS